MSGDCKEQPHIYYTEYGRKTLEEYYVNKIEALNEEVERLKGIVDYLESKVKTCLLYTSPSPRDKRQSRMPSSA